MNLFEKKKAPKKVIYGVTDRSDLPFLEQVNEFLIDHSPVKTKEKALFFNSFQLMVSSGIRLTQALDMLARRMRNQRLKRILYTVRYDMTERGTSLSAAMQKYPRVFQPAEIKMVYSGELTGKMEDVLDTIAKRIQKNLELDARIRNALMYPATVLGAIVLASVVVLTFVVPRFETLFADFGADLPFATKFLLNSSTFVRESWWLIATIIVAGIFLFRNWVRSEDGRRQWDGMLLKMPLIHSLVNNIQTTRIAGNFSTMMRAGIPVIKALRILSEVVTNRVVGDAILEAEHQVRRGKQVHEGFQQDVFDPVLGEVIEVGEQSGSIPEILEKTAAQYQMEVDAQLRNLTTLIEPIVIILVGGAVLFMAFAILTPIFKMQQMFAG